MWRCTLSHICVFDRNFSLGVPLLIGSCHFSNPHQGQIIESHSGVLCQFDFHTGNLYLNSWKVERTPLPHPTLFQKTRGKPYTLKTQTSRSVKSTIHLLVANAMSVCNLVSTLFFCLSLPRVVSDLNMSYFSEVMVVGRDGGGKF